MGLGGKKFKVQCFAFKGSIGFAVQMFCCSNVRLFCCSIFQMFCCSSVQCCAFKGSNYRPLSLSKCALQGSNIRLFKVQCCAFKCSNVRLFKCSAVQLFNAARFRFNAAVQFLSYSFV